VDYEGQGLENKPLSQMATTGKEALFAQIWNKIQGKIGGDEAKLTITDLDQLVKNGKLFLDGSSFTVSKTELVNGVITGT
jgi:hypothetical protein